MKIDQAFFDLHQYVMPQYRISPIDNQIFEDLLKVVKEDISESDLLEEKYFQRFVNRNIKVTKNGREALYMALQDIDLKQEDEILIFTTSQKNYISGCVTGEVEKFCKWSRELSSKTKAILIIHEFGFTCDLPDQLKKLNLPIIEDCAYAFNSADTGNLGDYIILSLSKLLPLPIGGILLSKNKIGSKSVLSQKCINQLCGALSYYLTFLDQFSEKQIDNYKWYMGEFKKAGLSPLFSHKVGEVPGAFIFRLDSQERAVKLKEYLYKQGIECSVFYGSGGFFIPCHHRLGEYALEYICSKALEFLNN